MVALDKFVRSKYQEKAFTRSGSGKLVESAQTKSMATIGSMQFSGVLLIKVKSARQLICLDVTSQSDPYVAAEMEGGQQKVRTKTVKDCANPVWDEVLMLNVRNFRSDVLRLAVWDADTLSEDDKIGHCEIPLRHLLRRASNDEHDEGHVRRMPDVATTGVFDDLILTGGDPHPCICVRLFQRNTPRGFLSVELTYQPLE
ncbi:ADP-ribosylation factor GTPase-activating protein AGD12 (ARF GAP AGD12) (Protein ARF-GAP DOMAIN 12) (AtAGD12) (Zinc- and calcium-binding protein) (AtZAC) [Durusdinium trenchii]